MSNISNNSTKLNYKVISPKDKKEFESSITNFYNENKSYWDFLLGNIDTSKSHTQAPKFLAEDRKNLFAALKNAQILNFCLFHFLNNV